MKVQRQDSRLMLQRAHRRKQPTKRIAPLVIVSGKIADPARASHDSVHLLFAGPRQFLKFHREA